MAEPKSLLDRIGDALKGEEKKAEVEAEVKKVEPQAQRTAEAAASKTEDVKQAVAGAADAAKQQVADLRSKLTDKDRELTQKTWDLNKKERELSEKVAELAEKDKQIASLQATLKEAQDQVARLSAQAPASRSMAAEKTYVVKPGDSLSAIAKAVYGNAARWPELFEANKDIIKDPKLIRPGQELRIP